MQLVNAEIENNQLVSVRAVSLIFVEIDSTTNLFSSTMLKMIKHSRTAAILRMYNRRKLQNCDDDENSLHSHYANGQFSSYRRKPGNDRPSCQYYRKPYWSSAETAFLKNINFCHLFPKKNNIATVTDQMIVIQTVLWLLWYSHSNNVLLEKKITVLANMPVTEVM